MHTTAHARCDCHSDSLQADQHPAMAASSADMATALLNSTRDGTYPESEEVLTTNLSASAFQPALQLIGEAKQQIEVSGLPPVSSRCPANLGFAQTDIKGLSQNSSSDVDEWITQARHLQEDIQRSKAVAREIVKEYEEGHNLLSRVQDARAKLDLLQQETLFNQAVTLSLEDTWSLDRDLNEAESTLASGRLVELVADIEQLSLRIQRLANSNAKDINAGRVLRIREVVVEGLTAAATSMVGFPKADGCQRITVDHGNHGR
jgi:protein transport protein DSL1/ZW10